MRMVFECVDNARDAVFDQGHLEVDEQVKTLVGEPEIGQKLFLMDRGEQLHGFDFQSAAGVPCGDPGGKVETAYHKADRAIQQVLDLLAAA